MLDNKNYIVPDWPAPLHIKAYSTTRLPGQGLPPYDHFNLARHVGDAATTVTANRKKLKEDLALPNEPVWIEQVHGNQVVCADQINGIVQADASYTKKPQTVCTILTADCLPLLLCNQEGTQVAAIHAGWKGLVANVIENTLNATKMVPYETLAWLGPAIGPTIFEVGEEVREQFLQADPEAAKAFIPLPKKKYLANIFTLAKQRLAKHGIEQVYGGTYCTYVNHELFFSYRRDQGKTGRMATLIWMEKKHP